MHITTLAGIYGEIFFNNVNATENKIKENENKCKNLFKTILLLSKLEFHQLQRFILI